MSTVTERNYEHEAAVGRTAVKRMLYALAKGKVQVVDADYYQWFLGAAEILDITISEMDEFTLWQEGMGR
jgi:hypothetical protein